MRLVIIGAGGYGQSVGDVAGQLKRYSEIIYLDDDVPKEIITDRCEAFSKYISDDTEIYPALGNNELRLNWIVRIENEGGQLATIVHPSAYVSPSSSIGQGVVVMPMASIGTGCSIDDGAIINMGAIVDHGCVIEECVHVAPGAIIKAENRIPMLTKVESGAVIQNREYPLNG